jgi:diguanylate cyclase (GGDEF)-like protein
MDEVDGKVQTRVVSVVIVIALFVLMLGVTAFLTVKNTSDLRGVLRESVQSDLLSISIAARQVIDTDAFDSYNSLADVHKDQADYDKTLAVLRELQTATNATYIYVLKQIDGAYYFIFDTDLEDETIFSEYDIFPVHEKAFLGKNAADILNVVDEWGSFNTGAVLIWKEGKVIGIVSTDIEDTYIRRSADMASFNTALLIVVMVASMVAMVAVSGLLLRRIQKMQAKLYKMANYDVITGLPNRQYLMNYLQDVTKESKREDMPFALLFVDLDNFKRVNDNAGHDAGDELLRAIGLYLDGVHDNSKSFRPAPGILNVSARIGGDEFVQVVPGVGDIAEAEIVAKRVLDNFELQSMDHFIKKFDVGLSIGVAIYPYHSDNFNVLIKYADIAMYHAKKEGKHIYRIYNHDMNPKDEK